MADFRVKCVADDLAGPGTCAALHAAGAIENPDAVAGATCKAVTEDPSLLAAYGPAAEAIAARLTVTRRGPPYTLTEETPWHASNHSSRHTKPTCTSS